MRTTRGRAGPTCGMRTGGPPQQNPGSVILLFLHLTAVQQICSTACSALPLPLCKPLLVPLRAQVPRTAVPRPVNILIARTSCLIREPVLHSYAALRGRCCGRSGRCTHWRPGDQANWSPSSSGSLPPHIRTWIGLEDCKYLQHPTSQCTRGRRCASGDLRQWQQVRYCRKSTWQGTATDAQL